MDAKEKRNAMKSFRVRAGLSQEKAAELLGVARQTLCYYERKPYSLSVESFIKMQDIYGEDFTNFYIAQKLYKK